MEKMNIVSKRMKNSKTLKVLQLTDTHLFKDPSLTMKGCNPAKNFLKIISIVKDKHLEEIDAIFLTGDLSQDETPDSYRFLLDHLMPLQKDIYWIPGNHDDLSIMKPIFSDYGIPYTNNLFNDRWNFIFLNSAKPNEISGYLEKNELSNLSYLLKQNQKKQQIVILHHHPIIVETPIVDEFKLTNADAFYECLTGFNVRLIVSGHVHGHYDIHFHDIPFVTSPATSLQWVKGAKEIQINPAIGYTIFEVSDAHISHKVYEYEKAAE